MAPDPRSGEAGGTGGREVPADRHPDQQQSARRHRPHLRHHPVQQREPAPAHRPDLPFRRLLLRLRQHPGRRADDRAPRLVPGDGRRRAPDPAPAPRAEPAGGADPLRRPALLDGHHRVRPHPPPEEGGPDDRGQAGHPRGGAGLRHPPPGRLGPGRRVRREAEGPGTARRPGLGRPDPGRPRVSGAPGVAPRQHGDLYLSAGGAHGAPDRELDDRLRPRGHPPGARRPPGLRLPLRGLLDRHRHHPELPPGQPRPHPAAAADQPLRSELPDLHPSRASCRGPRSTSASSSTRSCRRGASCPGNG